MFTTSLGTYLPTYLTLPRHSGQFAHSFHLNTMSNSQDQATGPRRSIHHVRPSSIPSTSPRDEALLDLPASSLVENDNVIETTVASDADARPEDECEEPLGRPRWAPTIGWLPGAPGPPRLAPSVMRAGPSTPFPLKLLPGKPLSRVLEPVATAPPRGVPNARPDLSSHDLSVHGNDNTDLTSFHTGTDDVATARDSSDETYSQVLDDDIKKPAGAEATQDSSQWSTAASEASYTEYVPNAPCHDSASTSQLRDKDDASPSRQQWIRRKEENGEDNDALDELMLLDGLENVKAHFLSVYENARAARRRGDDLQRMENLDTCFVGGGDFGE